jgi:hypothetical protein
MGRRLPADPAEAIGTAVVKYNYQVLKLLNLIFLSVLCDISELIIFVNCEGHVLCSYWYISFPCPSRHGSGVHFLGCQGIFSLFIWIPSVILIQLFDN